MADASFLVLDVLDACLELEEFGIERTVLEVGDARAERGYLFLYGCMSRSGLCDLAREGVAVGGEFGDVVVFGEQCVREGDCRAGVEFVERGGEPFDVSDVVGEGFGFVGVEFVEYVERSDCSLDEVADGVGDGGEEGGERVKGFGNGDAVCEAGGSSGEFVAVSVGELFGAFRDVLVHQACGAEGFDVGAEFCLFLCETLLEIVEVWLELSVLDGFLRGYPVGDGVEIEREFLDGLFLCENAFEPVKHQCARPRVSFKHCENTKVFEGRMRSKDMHHHRQEVAAYILAYAGFAVMLGAYLGRDPLSLVPGLYLVLQGSKRYDHVMDAAHEREEERASTLERKAHGGQR